MSVLASTSLRHDKREDEEGYKFTRRSTRHEMTHVEGADLSGRPRLGRRESEPHSSEVNYLHDVLTTNFPEDRVMWDLHHYFTVKGNTIDMQFDISFFRGFYLPHELSSYRASEHDNRIPTMAVNILSKSTYNLDIGLNALQCRDIGIPVYIVFNPYLPNPWSLRAPFLRVHYIEDPNESYIVRDLREACLVESEDDDEEENAQALDPDKLVDVRPDLLPFMFGIKKLRRTFEGGLPRYRLILVDRTTLRPLPTRVEQERQRAEQERQRAEQAEKKLKELEEELKKLKTG